MLYNRGVSAAVVTVEAIRVAQDKFGKGKMMSGDQMRWAFENLNVTNARLQQLGATGLLPEIKTQLRQPRGLRQGEDPAVGWRQVGGGV